LVSLVGEIVGDKIKIMKINKLLVFFWLILLFLVFLLRLPSLFEPFTYGDEGIYLTLGLAIRKGLILYRDIHDNKPPLLYLLAALVGNFANFRTLLFGWTLWTLLVFFKLAKKIFPKDQKSVFISTFIFAILISLHTFEGNIANAENFLILPTLGGILLVLEKMKSQNLFLAGVAFSLATLFKVPAAFDFLAVLVFLGFIFLRNKKSHFPLLISSSSLLIAGFLLPISITLLYFLAKGALNYYLEAAFFQNIPYLTSWGSSSQRNFNLLQSGLLLRGVLLFTTYCFLFTISKKISQNFLLIILWFSSSLFAALLSSRPYPHYLIQVLPSLSFLAAFALVGKIRLEKTLAFFSFFIFGFSFLVFHFWSYPNIPYYQNFYQYAFGQKSKNQYFADFDQKASKIYQTAEFITSHTLPQQRIFVWGNEPYLYALSRRLPPGRYTVAYHIIDFNGEEETFKAIEQRKTKLVVTAPVVGHSFPALERLLASEYIKIEEIGEFKLFLKTSEIRNP